MAIQSVDNLISAISAGQTARYDWNKITGASAYTAGRWYDTSLLAGLPIANAWAGTALNWRTCDEATGNGTQIFGIPHGGNVSTNIKHLLNMNAWSTAATGVPGANQGRLGFFSDIYFDPQRNAWWGLSDRGPGGGLIDYATRVQRFTLDIDPATGAIARFQVAQTVLFTDAQGQALYSNATIYVNEKEAAYWLNAEQTAKAPKEVQGMFLMQQKAVAPYQANRRFKTFKAGDELFSGVKTIAAYGHTPGHTIYQFNSEGQTAIFWGDLVHSYQMQLNNPKIAFEYDYDQKQAVSTREQVLAQAAKNQWLVGGSHIPFPGLGYVRPASTGYDWTTVKYQSVLK